MDTLAAPWPEGRARLVRGEVFHLRPARGRRGPEQAGQRFAVVVHADELLALSTVLVAPTSRSAPARSFRAAIEIAGQPTRVLVEQTTAVVTASSAIRPAVSARASSAISTTRWRSSSGSERRCRATTGWRRVTLQRRGSARTAPRSARRGIPEAAIPSGSTSGTMCAAWTSARSRRVLMAQRCRCRVRRTVSEPRLGHFGIRARRFWNGRQRIRTSRSRLRPIADAAGRSLPRSGGSASPMELVAARPAQAISWRRSRGRGYASRRRGQAVHPP